jgi:hypothetical protein
MRRIFSRYCRIAILLVYFSVPTVSFGQDSHGLTCADVKNGVFYFLDHRDNDRETFTRKGGLQKESSPKKKETIFWEVNWLNDCTYTLKYQSGGENRSAGNIKFMEKHIVVIEILQVTEDYLTFRSAFDKITNKIVLADTLWIKQRQSVSGKTVNNPNADSILATRMKIEDSLDASYATLYVYRPGKFLNSMMNYNLMINDEPVCVVSNGCREVLKFHKTGSFRISAKIYGPEQVVTLDVKQGESYYIQCLCIWGIASHPALTIMNKEEGKAGFETAEKANLIHKE